jgi:hypothetical protein
MAAQSGIPLTFHTDDPSALKRELERLAASLAAYFGGLTGNQHAAVVQRRLTKRRLNDTTAAFGQITPVSLSKTTDILRISAPPPDPRNAGLLFVVRRDSEIGTIKLSSPGCLVNGFSLVELSSDVGFVWVLFDGENYYTEPGAAWGT